MDIRLFVVALLSLSIGVYFIPFSQIDSDKDEQDIPLVIFEKPTMFTLDEIGLSRAVKAKSAVKYKTRDEMFGVDILLKNRDLKKDFKHEKFKADIIIKEGDLYKLFDNIQYKRDDFIRVDTSQMFYNSREKIAYNKKTFEGTYYENYLRGTDLYLDANKNSLRLKNAHFELDMKNKDNR